MKKTSIILLSALLAPQLSLAADDHYVSVQVGGSMPTNKATIAVDAQNPFKANVKNSATFGASIGTRIYNDLFAELEYSYAPNYSILKSYSHGSGSTLTNGVTATKVRSHSFFANLNYHIKHNSLPFIPYVTVGGGLVHNKINNVSNTTKVGSDSMSELFKGKNKTNFAWQAGAGVLFPLNNKLELNVAIKYQDLGKIQSSTYDLLHDGFNNSTPAKVRLSAVNVIFGLKYKF